MKIYLISVLVLGILTQSDLPGPHCTSKPIFQHLPLTVGELLTGDVSNAFTGYNLNISIKKGGDVARVKDKIEILGAMNYPLNDITSAFVLHNGNSWGNYGHALTDDMGNVMLHVFNLNKGVPDLNKTYQVIYDPKTQCFDVALFLDKGWAIVDCVENNGNSSNIVGVRNKFIYINLATGTPK